MRYLTLVILCRVFELAGKVLVKPFSDEKQNRKMLEWYLEWDRVQRQHWIATFSFPLFSGIHPKNIFTTRIDDLRDELESFKSERLRIVDFGCGSGRTLELLASRISEGLGIDLNAPIGNSHVEIRNSHPQISFEYGEHTPATLRQRVAEFKPDLIVLSHVLEHLENPVDFLKAFQPFPLLICLPSEESWLQRLRAKLGLSTRSDSTHFREYTRPSVHEEFGRAGYHTEKIRYNPEGELVFIARF